MPCLLSTILHRNLPYQSYFKSDFLIKFNPVFLSIKTPCSSVKKSNFVIKIHFAAFRTIGADIDFFSTFH